MNHQGYIGVLHVDEDAGVLRGKVVNTKDTITFQGATIEEARAAFRESVDDYLEFCRAEGDQPEKPFSGRFVVRIRPELHRVLSAIAQSKGTSINKLVVHQLTGLAEREESGQWAAAIADERSSAPRDRSGRVPSARKGKAGEAGSVATREGRKKG